MRGYDVIHRMEAGETVHGVAVKYRLPVHIVTAANPNAEAYEGQRLIIPDSTGHTVTVQPGETVELLARRYRTTPEQLLRLNKAEYLYPFMVILVPSGAM